MTMIDDHILTFVHISDTHLHADPNFRGGSENGPSREGALRVIEAINDLPAPASLVLHTGDLGEKIGKPETYSGAHQALSRLRLPLLSIPGNHDRVDAFQRAILKRHAAEVQPHADQETEVNGVQFLLLDSHAEAETGVASGSLADEQLAWIAQRATPDDPRPLVVAVHHHPLPTHAPWLDAMRLRNGEALHQVLRGAGTRLRGVFYGHIHESTVTVRDGIPYYSAQSTWFQTRTWHGQETPRRDDVQLPGYNLVTLTRSQTQVRFIRV